MSDVRVTAQRWLWTPRNRPIRLIEIHSTRGGSLTSLTDYIATINWVQSPNNGSAAQGWGSSCSYVLGPNGEMATVLEDNQQPTYGAGYGGSGSTYAIDEYGIAYEWAQPNINTPFSDAMYARAAKEIAKKCRMYSIPPVMIAIPSQTGQVPTGIVRHDRCENGTKLGKSDPGPQFDEVKFITLLKTELEDDDMSFEPADRAALAEIRAMLFGDVDEEVEGDKRRLVNLSLRLKKVEQDIANLSQGTGAHTHQ